MSDASITTGLNARHVALDILNVFDPRQGLVQSLLDQHLPRTGYRGHCQDLVLGTLRNLILLDSLIKLFSGRPPQEVDRPLLNVLRMALYEILFCPDTAEYAIVNEACEQAKRFGKRKAAGFVNAVLRNILRRLQERDMTIISDPEDKAVLIKPDGHGARFDQPLLAPNVSLVNALHQNYSLPRWLIKAWVKAYGKESTLQICRASNRRASLYIRPNRCKITTDDLLETFKAHDLNVEKTDAGLLRLQTPGAVEKLPGYDQGHFSVQDVTAARVASGLDLSQAMRILDLCAAPGGKTTHLAELTGDEIEIVATDIDAGRLQRVQENATRLGLRRIRVLPYEGLEQEMAQNGHFDVILVDVPCSNSGVLAKRVEGRFRIRSEAVRSLVQVQQEILTQAYTLLADHGQLIYSTCSIQNEENQGVVRSFQQTHPDMTLVTETLTLPQLEPYDCDGGYFAVLVR